MGTVKKDLLAVAYLVAMSVISVRNVLFSPGVISGYSWRIPAERSRNGKPHYWFSGFGSSSRMLGSCGIQNNV